MIQDDWKDVGRLNQLISLERLELHLLDLPQKILFVSGIGKRQSRKTLIIKWIDKDGRIGYGECSCRPDPYYSAEFLEGVVLLVKKFVIPFLKTEQTYAELLAVLKRIRGWNFAKAAVEAAAFEVLCQQSKYNLSSEIQEKPILEIPVGVSLGIYENKEKLLDVVQRAIDDGYRRLKFKIAPFVNTKVFDYINPTLFDHNIHTGFDANGSFYQKDFDKLAYFINTYQTVIEQPLPPDRFDIYIAAKQRFPDLKICADEEVKSIGDLIKLHALKAIDELNLKIGRVGGVSNSIAILNYCHENEIPCWIGGMFETGIGRILNLSFASFLPDAKAHDLSPSSRYFFEDIVEPAVAMKDGFINLDTLKSCKVSATIMKKYTTSVFSFDFS